MTDVKENAVEPDYQSDEKITTWRRFLIGPILAIYMFSYIMSYYTITEYTTHKWTIEEFDKANITVNASAGGNAECDKSINTTSEEYKAHVKASSIAADYLVYFSLAQGIPAIFSNLILGSYTDALGRKFLVAVGVLGTSTRLILSTLVIYFKLDLLYVVGACLIEGFSGQYATTLQASLAYVSDITDPATDRVYGMALTIAMLTTSLTLASLGSGFLIQKYGYLIPMAVSAILIVIAFVMCIFFLPESFTKRKRVAGKSLKTILWNSVSFLVVDDVNKNRWKYRLLFLAHGLCDFSFLGRIGTETIFQMAPPFCWSADKVGIFGSSRTVGMMVIGLGFIKLLKCFLSDVPMAMLGVLSFAIAFLLTAFATNDSMLYSGALFSSLASLEMVVNLLSNVGTGGIYSLTVGFMRGFVFLVLSFFNVLSLISLLCLQIGWSSEKEMQFYEVAS